MSLGITHILNTSTVEEEIRQQLVEHPFFNATVKTFELQRSLITDQPTTEYDNAITKILQHEGIDYSDKIIEYWFQHCVAPSKALMPHCDYNYEYREKMKLSGDDWPHKVDKHMIVSPITLVVYLYISDDMEGGQLAISSRAWMEEEYPVSGTAVMNSKNYPTEMITPKTGDVLHFKGSEHYHWIEPVTVGERRSLLINFWPKELLS
jgi:hypothetical protein